jgi:RNA polymerase sigma-70 factor (ECF subfamily)
MPRTDAQIVAEALKGSQAAYADLLRRYQRPVHSLVLRMVRDPARAEDVAQEVFLKAFRALGSYDQTRKFSSWLFKIAHNTAIDKLRRKQLDTIALEQPEEERMDVLSRVPDERSETPEAAVSRHDLARALEEALGELRPEYREVMLLRFQEGLSYEEIAEIAGLPLGTVKTHIHRARKAMARHLAAAGWSPG